MPHRSQAVLRSVCRIPACVGKMEAYRKSPLHFGLCEMRKGSDPERAVPGAVFARFIQDVYYFKIDMATYMLEYYLLPAVFASLK